MIGRYATKYDKCLRSHRGGVSNMIIYALSYVNLEKS